MGIEVELRARFDQAKHKQLHGFLLECAEDLGVNDKHLYFYVFPDKLLKVVHNLSAETAKISLKATTISDGHAFPEAELSIAPTDVPTAVAMFSTLGFAPLMHEATNQRHDFRFRGVEIALKYSEVWGYHAEFEVLLPDAATADDQTAAVAQIEKIATDLDVRLMSQDEIAAFVREFEQQQEAAHASGNA